MKLTTTHAIANETVDEEVDIVSAECVIGMNVLQDLMTSLTDIVGGRSKTMQEALKTARRSCLDELRDEAQRMGAVPPPVPAASSASACRIPPPAGATGYWRPGPRLVNSLRDLHGQEEPG